MLFREWLGPGGLPGLQNRWRVALRAAVGSTPIHSRLVLINKVLVTIQLLWEGGVPKMVSSIFVHPLPPVG